MDNTKTFVIYKRIRKIGQDISEEYYCWRLIKLMKCKNEILIKTNNGCDKLAMSIISNIINASGWVIDQKSPFLTIEKIKNKEIKNGRVFYRETDMETENINYKIKRKPAIQIEDEG